MEGTTLSPKGERSTIIGVETRWRIFSKLLRKSYRFEELRKELGLSSEPMSRHLRLLSEQGVIEKAIEDNIIVYRMVLDEEIIRNQLWTTFLPLLFDLTFEFMPEEAMTLHSVVDSLTKLFIDMKKAKL